jgi:BirA family transcriptional regulator, biotin operon repressor / biotin---[acetyl-CoA-carboxylase] ligase
LISFRVEHLRETTSTSTLVLERARKGEPEGLVIMAEHQTAGRGQPGRKWESPERKNLLTSILLRPPIAPAKAPMLTQIGCQAVAQTLKSHYGILATCKRPNDVMSDGKKICGILTEAITMGSHLEAVVIGIGLNVNADLNELPAGATSMRILKTQNYEVHNVLENLLGTLKEKLTIFYRENHG